MCGSNDEKWKTKVCMGHSGSKKCKCKKHIKITVYIVQSTRNSELGIEQHVVVFSFFSGPMRIQIIIE